METRHYTSIEESKKLLELGLSPKTADMHYAARVEGYREKMKIIDWDLLVGSDPSIENNLFSYREGFIVPCWSVGALLELMPIIVSNDTAFEGEDAEGISTTYCKYLSQCEDSMYECKYKDNNCGATLKRFKASTMFEVIYDMVVWLLENKYLQVV